jgi:hypothetical protein
MKKPKGTIQSTATTVIPLLLYISKSRITNGLNVDTADQEPTSGLMYSIHITPFFMFSITIPVARIKNQKK